MMWDACRRQDQGHGRRHRHGHARSSPAIMTPTPSSGPSTYEDQRQQASAGTNAKHVISSAPMRQLVNGITPQCPEHVIKAADSLKYRDFLTVVLILKDRNVFDDNWIYIHDPSVKVGRVQNFKSWSPEMVPDPSMTCYGLEYFCFEGRRPVDFLGRRPDRAGEDGAGQDRPGASATTWSTAAWSASRKRIRSTTTITPSTSTTIRDELDDELSERCTWSAATACTSTTTRTTR